MPYSTIITIISWVFLFALAISGIVVFSRIVREERLGFQSNPRPFKLRLECGGRHASKNDMIGRLKTALYRQRITPDEYRIIEQVIDAHHFPEKDSPTTVPDANEPEIYLMWRAGILERIPSARSLWITFKWLLFFSVNALHWWFFRLPESGVQLFVMNLVGYGLAANFIVRLVYNRIYKGEWILDEAVAYTVNEGCFYFVFGLVLLIAGELTFRQCVMTLLAFAMMLGIPIGILWLVGRDPYRNILEYSNRLSFGY